MRNFHKAKPENISKLSKGDRKILDSYSGLPAEARGKANESEEVSHLRDQPFKP